MKKFLVFTAALFISLSASAAGDGGRTGIGIVAGVNTSNMSLGELVKMESSSIAGYRFGAAAQFPIALGFVIQPEIVACTKGARIPGAGGIANTIKANVSYLEIPVQFQYNLDLILIKPFVFVEPFAGLALGGRVDGEKLSFDTFRQRLEYGLGIGAGVNLFETVQLSCRYYWNMENVDSMKSYLSQSRDLFLDTFKGGNSFDGISVTLGFFF